MRKIFLFLALLLGMYTNIFAQYDISPRFFHIYAETLDGKIGTIGCLNTGKSKEIGGVTYTEMNVGELQEDCSCRWVTNMNGLVVTLSEEEMAKTGTNLYYREEGGRIYFYSEEKQTEELVMDFTLNIGDNFTLTNGNVMRVIAVEDTIPFAYQDEEHCRRLTLQEEGNPANTDVWIEQTGSMQTGILPCSYFADMKKIKVIGCSIEERYAFFPFSEDSFKAQWLKFLEVDESSETHLQYEFLGDTLCMKGYLNTSCGYDLPLQCRVNGTDIEISDIQFPYTLATTCTSTFKVEANFPGFKEGTYHVSFNGSSPVEVVCGDALPIHGIGTGATHTQQPLYNLSGLPAGAQPAQGIYITKGKKVIKRK